MTVSISDMTVPPKKKEIIAEAEKTSANKSKAKLILETE